MGFGSETHHLPVTNLSEMSHTLYILRRVNWEYIFSHRPETDSKGSPRKPPSCQTGTLEGKYAFLNNVTWQIGVRAA